MDVFVGQEHQDESTELAVLGGIILSPEQYHEVVQVGLTGKDFYIANHEVIFNALEDLILSGKPADLISIEEHLIKNRTSFFNEVLNPSEKGYDDLVKRRITNIRLIMVEAMDAVPVAANTSYYARIVVEKSRMRKVVQAGRNIISIGLGYQNHENVNDMVSAAHEEVLLSRCMSSTTSAAFSIPPDSRSEPMSGFLFSASLLSCANATIGTSKS